MWNDEQELEGIDGDPTRKEIGQIRKRIDTLNKELKPLGQICQKKVSSMAGSSST